MALEKTVCELFAGVGGFRLGLENASKEWQTVWANQWEPSKKLQHAYNCYCARFGASEHHVNIDIAEVDARFGASEHHVNIDIAEVDKQTIPNHNLLVGGFPCQDYSVARTGAQGIQGVKGVLHHVNIDIAEVDKQTIPNHNLLVGGFPCQDYSVARTGAQGIQGVKGVLWWQIRDILETKAPKFVVLENVDRLLKSPSKQRGRDFGVMLACFKDLGYTVEWRILNAAEYGFAQRRRRVFIFACKNETTYSGELNKHSFESLLKHHVNIDIAEVDKQTIPNHNLLVGGFPCQDYSVARTGAQGIQGVKGVLWWQIRDILETKAPKFVVLENVDRLLKSPSKQRGRDFGVMLACFKDLGYTVEWRILNAAEYGFAQRRRRVFIFACKNETTYSGELNKHSFESLLNKEGFKCGRVRICAKTTTRFYFCV